MLFLLLLSGGTPVITTGRLPKTWTGLSVPRKMTCWARVALCVAVNEVREVLGEELFAGEEAAADLFVSDALKECNDGWGGFGVESIEWSWIEA
eukprot:scaffold13395_cov71-Cyclotella_meneghiniana.AAC.7